ncbi:MAG: hypothetical protein QW146_09065 [Candidatus Bathyarchaeia archaeon]
MLFLGNLLTLPIKSATVIDESSQTKIYEFNYDALVNIDGKEYLMEGKLVVTEWYPNNTRKISVMGTLKTFHIQASLTQFTRIKLEEPRKVFGVFPNKYKWDNMWFLPQGENGTHWVKYTHDDNYDTYYPGQWCHPWRILPGQYGNTKHHIHFSYQQIQDWKKDVSRTNVMLGFVFGGYAGVMSLFAVIQKSLQMYYGILAVLAGLLEVYLTYKGFEMLWWIEDVVEAANGDGFCWYWEIKRYFYRAAFPKPGSRWYTVWLVCYTSFWMSWGKERDSPMLVSCGAGHIEDVCPGGGGHCVPQ